MRRIRTVAVTVGAAVVIAVTPLTASYAGGGSSLQPMGPRHDRATALPRTAGPGATPQAVTGPGTDLGLTSFGDIVADPAHGHVFVSGGAGANGVVVTDLAGNVKQTLDSSPGASGMVLSQDRSTLYVALADGDGIREIDTSTLAGTTVSTGASTCPRDLAVTAGLVWFSYSCDNANSGLLGTLDPATGTVHLGLTSAFPGTPLLAASPGLDGVLITGVPGESPATITRYDVTGGASPTATSTTSAQPGSNLRDLAMTPDGTQVVVASGSPYYQQVFKTSDLSADGTYQTSNYPDAVAIAPDGRVAAGIDGANSTDVWLYEPGATSPTKKWDFGSSDYLQPRGLAFAGGVIYAVTGDYTSGSPRYLHVLSTKPDAPLKVTTDRTAYRFGARAKVTIHLSSPGSAKGVAIYATPAGGKRVLVKSGDLSGGTFSARHRVTRKTLFTGVYEGGATYGPTSKTRTVKVHAKVATKLRGSYAKRHGYALYHVDKDPKLLATVSPNHAGECLYFVAQRPKAGGGWKTFGSTGCVPLSSTSQAGAVLTGTHVVGEKVRLRALWSGDPVSLKQKSVWSYVRFTR